MLRLLCHAGLCRSVPHQAMLSRTGAQAGLGGRRRARMKSPPEAGPRRAAPGPRQPHGRGGAGTGTALSRDRDSTAIGTGLSRAGTGPR